MLHPDNPQLTSSADTRGGNPEQNLISLELVGLGGSALDGFTLLGSLEDGERRHDDVCCVVEIGFGFVR